MSQYSDSTFAEDTNTSWQKTFDLIPKGSLVLDIGCSSGTFGNRLIKEKECIVDGIDINDEDLKAAKKVLRNTYRINIEQEPINLKHQYDVVFMGDVIEHLATPVETLKKVRKLLKPTGSLVFSIPNILHMSVRLMFLRDEINYGRTGLLDETHLHFYNSKEIYRVLNAAGFKIESFDYTVNDIPADILKKELKEIGLRAEQKFIELSQTLDAGAYQFIGRARLGNEKKQILPSVSPLNIIDSYHKKLKEDYNASTARIIADKDRILLEKQIVTAEKDQLLAENLRLKRKLSVSAKEFARKILNRSSRKD